MGMAAGRLCDVGWVQTLTPGNITRGRRGLTMAVASLHTARTVKVLTVVIAMGMLGLGIMHALAVAPATPVFERTWARTDKPVTDGEANRTWMWGPEGNTGAIPEPYLESPGGMRTVQYFDKSRMEITH